MPGLGFWSRLVHIFVLELVYSRLWNKRNSLLKLAWPNSIYYDVHNLHHAIYIWIIHCYQVNDCSSKILVIKGGAYFLRHCQPFSNKISLLVKGGTYFFQYKKYCPPFTNKDIFRNKRRNIFFFSTKNTFLLLLIKIFLVLKGGTYFFSVQNTVHLLVIKHFWCM